MLGVDSPESLRLSCLARLALIACLIAIFALLVTPDRHAYRLSLCPGPNFLLGRFIADIPHF